MATGTLFHAPFSLRDPGWLTAAGIALIPLVSYTRLLDFRLMPRALFLGIITVALLLMVAHKVFRRSKPTHTIRWQILWPFLLLAAAYVLSSLTALNAAEARFWVNKQLLILLFAFVMLILISLRMVNTATLAAGVATGLAIALLLLVRELYGFDFRLQTLHELSTPFGHKNLYATWLVITLPFLLFLLHNLRPGVVRTAIALLCVTAPVITLLLQAKAATIAMVVMALFYGAIVWSKYPRKRRIVVAALVFILLIMGVLALFALDGRFFTLRSGSFEERMIVWGNTWQMIGDNPVWGVGGGNWQIWFPKYGLHNFHDLNNRVYHAYETFQRPHNDYLWIYAEAGIVGLLAWLGVLAGTLWRFVKGKWWQRGIKDQHVLMTGGVVAFFVIALADFPLERFELLIMLVLLYLLSATGKGSAESGSNTARLLKVMLPVTLTLSLYLVIALSARTKAEHNHYKVLEAHSAGDWLRMSRLASVTNERVFNLDNFSIPVQWYAGVAQSALGNTAAAHHHFRQALAVNPWQVHVLNNLAGNYQQLGEHNEALKYYREALNIAPLHHEVLLNKSITLYNTGLTNEAFHTLLHLVYKREHQPAYHQAMPVIFNAYLEKLINSDDTDTWNHQSLDKLIRSDSLKIVLLYHHQIEGMKLEGLLNGF